MTLRHPNRLNKNKPLRVRPHTGEKHICDCRKCHPEAYVPSYRARKLRAWIDSQDSAVV